MLATVCFEGELDGGEAVEIGDIAGVVGDGVGCEDLFRKRVLVFWIISWGCIIERRR